MVAANKVINEVNMKRLLVTILYSALLLQPSLAQIRVVSDCTIIYSISTDAGKTDKDVREALNASTKTVYIRGNDSRTDLVSPSFSQSLFFDKTTGNVVILREFGNNKFMTQLDNSKWISENKKYEMKEVDILGNTVLSGDGISLEGENRLDLDLTRLAKGFYFLVLLREGLDTKTIRITRY